ncbi:MAG: hypothetical protein H6913_09310 [Altererythrobacter sp.]|nr:hypothetical protein [Altererythrobacter sp.]
MIAAWHNWHHQSAARLLGLPEEFARHAPDCAVPGGVARAVSVTGWIDGPGDLLAEVGGDICHAYALALDRWGKKADARLTGNYAAAAIMRDGSVRLSRSPWDAPPLHYACDSQRVVASSQLRLLFAAGIERQLDYERITDQLAYDFRDGEVKGWYRGIFAVPLGSVVRCAPDGWQVERWYDPADFLVDRRVAPTDAAERALSLLREAARLALKRSEKPGLALSGGLDSPLAATALLDELPPGTWLDTITFAPDPRWKGKGAPGTMGDETPLVRHFAEMHPRIAPHFVLPDHAAADGTNREMLRAMQLFAPGLANVEPFHAVFAKARDLGCDTLLVADLANQSFSQDGRWAYVEYAWNGRWAELTRLLANRPGDGRSLLRKLLALSVMPQLPAPMRGGLRSLVHPQRRDMVALLTPPSRQAIAQQAQRAAERGSVSDWSDFTFPHDRAAAVRHDHLAADGEKADVMLAFEQAYGVSRRDVTAYRPLIEYCIGLPTAAFASGGTERRLAREMARGRLPEAQRLGTEYGQHRADWHLRIGEQREQYRAALHTMRGHEFLGRVLDIDRLDALLRDWPDESGGDIERDWPRMLAIPRAILASQFVGVIEGRNDL